MSDYRDRDRDRNRNQDDRYPVARRSPGQMEASRYQQRERTPEEMARIRAARKREAMRKKKRKQRITIIAVIAIAVILIVVVILIATGSNKDKNNNNTTTAKQGETQVVVTTGEETTTENVYAEVTLLSVGDVLMHTPLLNYADNWDGTYDFNSIFSQLTGVISAADIAICNQETPVDPQSAPDGGAQFIFNTPPEIGDAEINAGFDVVLQASNHSYDQGAQGILNTVAYWKTRANEITMIGMNDSQEARDTIPIIEKNGIKFAMLNYTYGLNGFYMPDDMQYLVTLIDEEHSNYNTIVSDIQKAESMADFVIVFPHWGIEDAVGYSTDEQDYWAKVFTEAGADLIIGTHPHVCEQIEWITADNGNRALCYFSLGNFASNQQELPEVLCGMASVKIIKDGGKTYIDEGSTGVIPVVTHNVNMGDFTNAVTVYRLSEYNNDLAYQHDIFQRFDSSFCKENLDALAYEVFGEWIIN